MEDQPADSGDLTTESGQPAAGSRRRLRLPWRRRKAGPAPSAEETVAPDDEGADDAAAPKVPVGKVRRGAAATPEAEHPEPETAGVEPAEDPAADEPAEPAAETEPAEPGAETEAGAETEEQPVEKPVLVPHRPAGRRLAVVAVAAGVVFVGAATFAGSMLQPYLADRALAHAKLEVAETAVDAINTLWTYTPDNLATLPDRSKKYLAGDFANDYRRYIDAIAAPNKQAQVSNNTQVMGAAVESISPTEATALVYTNSVATSPVTKNIPSLRYLSYRLSMERRDARWLITQMTAVTSLDLTPRL